MGLRGLLRSRRGGFSGQEERENYWENISFLNYYPNERRAEIYPAGVRVDISPVKEVAAREPARVFSYSWTDPPYINFDYYMYPAKVVYEPHTEIVRMWRPD